MKHKVIFDNAALDRFASAEWSKTLNYLSKNYGLSQDNCKDVFQESFIILYRNISEGKLTELTSSLSTYFTSICRNKAMEMLRGIAKMSAVDDETSLTLMEGEFKEEKIHTLISLDDNTFENEKQDLINGIVNDLPSPCNELLWGFYRDGLSLKVLAKMHNYSEASIKVVKFRCTEKFRLRYKKLVKDLFK
jgi:RNA polymerase sigma factor (sigma-70 family)